MGTPCCFSVEGCQNDIRPGSKLPECQGCRNRLKAMTNKEPADVKRWYRKTGLYHARAGAVIVPALRAAHRALRVSIAKTGQRPKSINTKPVRRQGTLEQPKQRDESNNARA